MAVFTIGGRVVAANLLKQQTYFLGVGTGDPAWDSGVVPPPATAADLYGTRVGATRVREVSFATPNLSGDIAMSDGSHFDLTDDPTRYVYLRFKLDVADATGNTVRESGIYHGVTIDPAVPGGQFWIPAVDIITWGTLIELDRFNSIVRDGTLEQEFSTILTL